MLIWLTSFHLDPTVIMEQRTARLTLLIDPNKKAVFERLCRQQDVTPSQMVRRFIREFIEQELGPDWQQQVFSDDEPV